MDSPKPDGVAPGSTIDGALERQILDILAHSASAGDAAQAITQLVQRRSADAHASIQAVLDAIPESIFVVDTQGCVLLANDTWARRLGTTVGAARGRDVREFIPPDVMARRLGWAQETLLSGTPKLLEDEREGAWLRHYFCPVRDADGVIRRMAILSVDRTAQRAAEEQLRQSQKLEAIGQLAGGIAHDFNNSLAATMMHLGLLLMSPGLPEHTRKALKELELESKRAADLTRQLLMFSRRSILDVRPHQLNDLIANLLKMLGRVIGERISLRFDPAVSLPPVDVDAGMIEQVLLTLVVNARDTMPNGGVIAIQTSARTLGKRELDINAERRPGRFVCLSILDSGEGLDDAVVARVFEPFVSSMDPAKTTGMGLATVHGVIAQHNGWVEVGRTIGKGMVFTVYLPAAAAAVEEGDTATGSPVQSPVRGDETILLVEDEAPLRKIVSKALAEHGYTVIEAANGQEALALWPQYASRVALLFTDIVMPGRVSGVELVRQLKTLRPGLKAIVSSGYNSEMVDAGQVIPPGVRMLPKPYDAWALALAVRQCLDEPEQ